MSEIEKNTTQELSELAPSLVPALGVPTYEVPDGYFDTFPVNLLKLTISHSSGIQDVPAHYFEHFAEDVLIRAKSLEPVSSSQTEVSSPAPVRPLGIPRFSMMRYAVAAACTGLLGLGIFQWMQSPSEQFSGNQNLTAQQILRENRYEEVFQSISGEEIIAYLETSGHDVNAALVAEAALEEELPAPEDYWLDENTLDQFLQKLNLPEIKEM